MGISTAGRLGMGLLGLRYPAKNPAIASGVSLMAGVAILLLARPMPVVLFCNTLIDFFVSDHLHVSGLVHSVEVGSQQERHKQ